MKQGDQWRIVMSQRTDLARLKQPAATDADLYPPGNDANAQIKTALTRAARDHKRVLIVFGANWCYDCHAVARTRGSAGFLE
jgi:thiol:disulfide interchange protein